MLDQEGIQGKVTVRPSSEGDNFSWFLFPFPGVEGAIFIFINENTFPALYAVLNLFPMEFPIFLREHKAGLYAVDSYYISKALALVWPVISILSQNSI